VARRLLHGSKAKQMSSCAAPQCLSASQCGADCFLRTARLSSALLPVMCPELEVEKNGLNAVRPLFEGSAINSSNVPIATQHLCDAAKAQLIDAYKDTQSPNFKLYAECLQVR
jgi:hypothetical protein